MDTKKFISIWKLLKVMVYGIVGFGISFLPYLNEFPQTPEIILITSIFVYAENKIKHMK